MLPLGGPCPGGKPFGGNGGTAPPGGRNTGGGPNRFIFRYKLEKSRKKSTARKTAREAHPWRWGTHAGGRHWTIRRERRYCSRRTHSRGRHHSRRREWRSCFCRRNTHQKLSFARITLTYEVRMGVDPQIP